MIAQELRGLVRALGSHPLPESDGRLGIITCQRGKDQSHVVSLALMIARVAQVLEIEAVSDYCADERRRVCAHTQHTGNCRTNLESLLLFHLRTHLLGRVARHSVGNLMSQHDGQRRLVLSDGQNALIDHNQSARHTPGIHLLVLNEIERPVEVGDLRCQTVGSHIIGHSIGEVLPHPLHHRGIGGIGRQLRRLHKLLILLIGQT